MGDKIQEILPLSTPRCTVEFLDKELIPWYIDMLYEPFFGEFIDDKPKEKHRKSVIKKLEELVSLSRKGLYGDIRLVIKIDNKPIGGISLATTLRSRVYNLGYWILPQYQSMGIATEVVGSVCNAFLNIGVAKTIIAEIQCINTKSINIVEGLNFKYVKTVKGKYTNNIVYKLDADKQ